MEALRRLHDERLYRSTHPNWNAYCRDVFRFTGKWAGVLLDREDIQGLVNKNLKSDPYSEGLNLGNPVPISAKSARQIARVPKPKRERMVRKALKEGGGKLPSTKRLKEIAEELLSLPRGGVTADARRDKLQEEAAKLRDLRKSEVQISEPIDTDASDAWTPEQVKRIHNAIDAWAAQIDPDKQRDKFWPLIDRLKEKFK